MNRRPPLRLVFWESTKACNLNCLHCRASAAKDRDESELTQDEVKRIVNEIAQVGSPVFIISGGEPLVRPHILDIAAFARSKGLKVALASNGTLINEVVAKEIHEAGIRRVAISLDGASAETHDAFRQVPGSFESALEGARSAQAAGLEVQVNVTVTRHNVDDLPLLLDLAHERRFVALHTFLLVPVGCGVEIAQDQTVSPEKYEEVLRWFCKAEAASPIELKATCAPHFFRVRAQMKKEGLLAARDGAKTPFHRHTRGCLAGSTVCFISHVGKVQPCGYLPVEAGDLRTSSFETIWNESPVFLELRDPSLLQGKCGQCDYRIACGGCRARAQYAAGDYLAEEPYCVYQPKRTAP